MRNVKRLIRFFVALPLLILLCAFFAVVWIAAKLCDFFVWLDTDDFEEKKSTYTKIKIPDLPKDVDEAAFIEATKKKMDEIMKGIKL